MRKIRITYLIDGMLRGGAEALLSNVVNRLDPDQFQCTIVTLHHRNEFPLKPHVRLIELDELFGARSIFRRWLDIIQRTGAVPTVQRPPSVTRRPSLLRILYAEVIRGSRVLRVLRTIPTDILHTHLRASDNIGQFSGWLLGIPVLCTTIHSTVEWPRSNNRFTHRVEDALISLNDTVFAVSKHLKSFVVERRGVSNGKTQLLYNGIDTQQFQSSAAQRILARTAHRIDANDLVIVCVAQFREEKRHDLLLEAFAHIAALQANARLVLVGSSGHHKRAIEKAIQTGLYAERIRIVGASHEHLPEVLAMGDIFTMQSANEGGPPLAMLEAISSGLPVVVPNQPPFTEGVSNGQHGYLFEPGNAVDQAECIMRVAHDITTGNLFWNMHRESVIHQFAIQTHVSRLSASYVDLCKKRIPGNRSFGVQN